MAAGDPFHTGVVEAYLRELIEGDVAIAEFAPGGYIEVPPNPNDPVPVVRSWLHVPGDDTIRQDGRMGRAQSNPVFVVTMLDLQDAQRTDPVYGTVGGGFKRPRPYLRQGASRIYKLLHARTTEGFECDGFVYSITSHVLRAYRHDDPITGTQYDVMVGHFVQFWVS